MIKKTARLAAFPFIYLSVIIFYKKSIRQAKQNLLKCDVKPENYKKHHIPFIVTSHYVTNPVSISNSFKNTIDEFVNHTPHINAKKLGRNELCYCGSGKKYKNCCLK